MGFLGIKDIKYWNNNKLEILKRLAEKGAYEKFLEFGNKIDWTL